MTGTHASVNGMTLYHEIHGTGRPLVLLHGGLLTIDQSFGALIPQLTSTHQLIAVELQGHGRTPDADRAFTMENLAGDVVALLDHLGVDRADLFGFSLGGLVATQLAVQWPERVDRLVLAASHFRPDGYHDEIREGRAGSSRMPSAADFQEMQEAYTRVAPDPGHFAAFAERLSTAVGTFAGWSPEEIRSIAAPTLVMIGDHDFVRIEHATELRDLVPDAQLAVLPGTTHMELTRRADVVVPILERFLARP